MKPIYLLVLALFFCGCKVDQENVLDVEFKVVDFTFKKEFIDTHTEDERNKASAMLTSINNYFKFTKDGKLYVDSTFGKTFLNDSIFNYKIDGNIVELEGKSGKNEIILSGRREENFIDIYFENDIFKRVGLLKPKKAPINKNKELVGSYVIGGYGLGYRYQKNTNLGHDLVQSTLKSQFQFKPNDTLVMPQEFGKSFFGEHIFHYAFDGKLLVLEGEIGRFDIPVKKWQSEGTFELLPNDGYFTSLIFSLPRITNK